MVLMKVALYFTSSRCAHLNWSVVYFPDLLWKLSSLETSEGKWTVYWKSQDGEYADLKPLLEKDVRN